MNLQNEIEAVNGLSNQLPDSVVHQFDFCFQVTADTVQDTVLTVHTEDTVLDTVATAEDKVPYTAEGTVPDTAEGTAEDTVQETVDIAATEDTVATTHHTVRGATVTIVEMLDMEKDTTARVTMVAATIKDTVDMASNTALVTMATEDMVGMAETAEDMAKRTAQDNMDHNMDMEFTKCCNARPMDTKSIILNNVIDYILNLSILCTSMIKPMNHIKK